MRKAGRRRRAWLIRWRLWARRVRLTRSLAVLLTVAAVASGVATMVALTSSPADRVDPRTVILLIYLDVVFVLALVAVIARRLVGLWIERKRGLAGSGLHARVVLLFGLVTATPAILVVIFAALFLNFGVQVWFSDRVSTAIEASRAVAISYLEEHRKAIRADILAMAADLNRESPRLMRNEQLFNWFLTQQADVRSLPEAVVLDSSGNIIARTPFSLSLQMDDIPRSRFDQTVNGQVVILTTPNEDRVRAIVQLDRFVDAYLVVGRLVDPEVIAHIERTEGAVAQFKKVEEQRESFQITFVMIFVVVAILLLLAAIWIGLTFADQLTRPISNLIGAAERVRKGDLSVRVEARAASDEMSVLSRAFNRMTSQLESQRKGLIQANQELDERRRFTEAVLEGVSAGVIGLDSEGHLHLPNRYASEFLGIDPETAIGQPFGTVVPEMAEFFEAALRRPDRQNQAEIRLDRETGTKILHVRMAAERAGDDIVGYVVTFDDITELLSAQRKAAWADIARRIAHEIKNPLTPIQLSAERLRRKYHKEIESDPETFALCTDTIIRHVGDIGRMVDEFSSFARMPQPSLKPEDLGKICRQAVFLERNRYAAIRFDADIPEHPVPLHCDAQLVGRALTNVLKNAAESVKARLGASAGSERGRIGLSIIEETGSEERVVRIQVDDNGLGWPSELRDRLTEPYVTTRAKGTGLGLAIVKKIMEDHDGDLLLMDRVDGGARVVLEFRGQPVGLENVEPGPSEGTSKTDPMTIATDIRLHGA